MEMSNKKQQIPAIRFNDFTDTWEQRKLGELLTEVKRPIKMKDDECYELVTVKRRNEGIVSRGIFRGKDVLVKSQFQIKTGDYLISKRQVVHGANGIVPSHLNNAIVSNEYLVSIGNKNITTDFLTIISRLPSMYRKFFLSSYGIDIEKLVFNVEDWKKRTIRVPGVSEQNQISIFYKQIDSTIALHQRQLDNYKELKNSMLQKMLPQDGKTVPKVRFPGFTVVWKHCKLSNLYEKGGSGGTPKSTNKSYYMGDIPFLGISDISASNGYVYDTEKHISEEGLKNSSAWIVPKEAISLAMYASVGKVAILKTDAATSQAFYNMVFKNMATRNFVFQYLLKKESTNGWSRLVSTGTQSNLNAQKVRELEIMIPSIEEQEKIGTFFKQLDDTIAFHQQRVNGYQEFKKVMLQQMFV